MKVTRVCPISLKLVTRELDISEEQIAEMERGTKAVEVLTNLEMSDIWFYVDGYDTENPEEIELQYRTFAGVMMDKIEVEDDTDLDLLNLLSYQVAYGLPLEEIS